MRLIEELERRRGAEPLRAFARRLGGISFATYEKWRLGRTRPSAESIQRIVQAMPDLDLNELLAGEQGDEP